MEPGLSDVSGLVLAGGRGLRMGGADKGLLLLRGRPLAQRALDSLRPQVAGLAISANRNLARYAGFGVPVLVDAESGFPGPLAGWLAGLRHCRTAWLVTLPCDMPAPPQNLVEALLRAAKQDRAPAAYAVMGGRAQYACALLHCSLLVPLEQALAARRHVLREFLDGVQACAVAFEHAAACNLNTPAELEAAI